MPALSLSAPPFNPPTSTAGVSVSQNNIDFVGNTVEFSNNGFSGLYEPVFTQDGNGLLDAQMSISFTVQRRSVAMQLTSTFVFSGGGSGANEYHVDYIDGTLSVYSSGLGTVYSAATSLWTSTGSQHALELRLASPNGTLYVDSVEVATFDVGTVHTDNQAEYMNIRSEFDSTASVRTDLVLLALAIESLTPPPPPPPPPSAPVGTGIRFPVELPLPLREGYAVDYEETRRRVQPEVGSSRQRRLFRSEPRLERLVWSFTQQQYRLFDLWWQNTIESGAREFDVLLTDLGSGTVWFTARWFGDYEAVIDNTGYRWRVSAVFRLIGEPFADRPSGTDELIGRTSVGLTASGNLRVDKQMRGAVTLEVTGRGRLNGSGGFPVALLTITGTGRIPLGPMRGSTTIGVTATADFQFEPVQRVWVGLVSWRTGRSYDIVQSQEAVQRNQMRLGYALY